VILDVLGCGCLYHHGLGSHQDEGITILGVPGNTRPKAHCHIPEGFFCNCPVMTSSHVGE